MSEGAAAGSTPADIPAARANLARELRARLGPPPRLAEHPRVSIVVPNRDGEDHLARLLPSLSERTEYPELELVVVDNGSGDGSVALLEEADLPFPLKLVLNAHNETFADACNQGAREASGELLLFLNNDTEVIDSAWLVELVDCLDGSGAGLVSSLLLHAEQLRFKTMAPYAVQHRGLKFRDEDGVIGPFLDGFGDDPLDERLGVDTPCASIAAAAALIPRLVFESVGGFTRGYRYGAEDVDLCFKLMRLGYDVVCSGRSVVLHTPGSTRRAEDWDLQRANQMRNRRLLLERWGPQLRREHDLDVLDGGGIWAAPPQEGFVADAAARARVDAPGFCLKVETPADQWGGQRMAAELERTGHRCVVQLRPQWHDLSGLNFDVAVHMRRRSAYASKPAQFNVLWDRGPSGRLLPVNCDPYDLVLVGDERSATRLRGHTRCPVEVLAAPRRPEPALAVAGESETQAAARPQDAEVGRRLVELVLAEIDARSFPLRIRT